MAVSQTKQRIIQRHQTNTFLQAPTLAPMSRSKQDLSVDQPTAPPDNTMVESAASAMEQGQTHYVDVPGIMPLREKLAGWLSSAGLVDYEPANLFVSAGIQESRFLTLQMIGDKLGSVGVPAVVHPGARQALGVRRLQLSELAVDDRQLPTLDAIRAALTEGCKLLYLESPSRLTGAAYGADEVAQIAALLVEFDAAAVWDQGLSPWTTDYTSLGSVSGAAERVAIIGEAWPGVGLESWYIAYIAANTTWVASMQSQKQIMAICTSTASQYAALAAADVYADRHAAQAAELAATRADALAQLEAVDASALPGAAASIIAARLDSSQVARLRDSGFEVADGAHFGAPGVARLAVTDRHSIGSALSMLSAEQETTRNG